MKKKIGILSFATACNHGAFLQVYALQGYLISKGYDAEVLNYRNKHHYLNEMKAMFFKKDISLIFYNLARLYSFKKSHKLLNMGNLKFDITNIDTKKYDCIIVGGDIVWDFNNPYLGHDRAYFGHKIKSKNLITYAASAGTSKVNNISDYVKSGITKFNHLGVRDMETLKIAQTNPNISSQIVLDTTLIYDFIIDDKRVYAEDYILIYAFEMTELDKSQIIEFASLESLKIVSITFNKNYKWADKNFYKIDPLRVLNLIKHASFIYTSTFHGLLLSIKYRKKLALRNNPTIVSKCSWLISSLEIESIDIDNSSNIKSIWGNKKIYTNRFEKVFSNLVEESKNYLNTSIEHEDN